MSSLAGFRNTLTPRELEVLAWMSAAKSNREIAAILGMAYATTKNHVHAIITKLGAASRTGAVVRAIDLGILTRSA